MDRVKLHLVQGQFFFLTTSVFLGVRFFPSNGCTVFPGSCFLEYYSTILELVQNCLWSRVRFLIGNFLFSRECTDPLPSECTVFPGWTFIYYTTHLGNKVFIGNLLYPNFNRNIPGISFSEWNLLFSRECTVSLRVNALFSQIDFRNRIFWYRLKMKYFCLVFDSWVFWNSEFPESPMQR